MLKLLKKNDNLVMSNSRFVKNATFYKDCFALYDLFENLESLKKDEMPNYCLENGKYILEGFCLVAKNYASELGFETMKLTLDYLKILYYSIANFANENGEVDKELILAEFDEYKMASVSASSNMKKALDEKKSKYEKTKAEYEKEANKYAKNLVLSKVFDVLGVFFLIFAFISGMVPFSFYFLGKLELVTAIITSIVLLLVGLALCILFKWLDKKNETTSNDVAYSMQLLKKNRDAYYIELAKEKENANKIISEKYEYENNFSKTLEKFVSRLSFKEIQEKASEYKLLSYNIKNDIERLFANEQIQINEILAEIGSLGRTFSDKEFAEVYSKIKAQDWLEYNNEIRFSLIKKVIDRAEKTNEWQVEYNNEYVNIFGVNLKKLAKEEIAYLKNSNDLFVSASLDKFLDTKYIKNLSNFELKNKTNNDELKNIKVEYLSHFYDYDQLKDMNNLFYDKKMTDGAEVSPEIQEKTQKIPCLIELKLKTIENKLGLGNSDSKVIKQMADLIFGREEAEKPEKVVIRSSDIIYPETECDGVQKIDEDRVRYIDGDHSFVGYKLSSLVPATEE